MAIQIVEIIGRSIQGITNPFICKCEDGQIYFVKGNGAGKQSLIAEYGGVGEDGSDGAGVGGDSEDCGCVEMVFFFDNALVNGNSVGTVRF